MPTKPPAPDLLAAMERELFAVFDRIETKLERLEARARQTTTPALWTDLMRRYRAARARLARERDGQ